jgi:hypothetical protein
MHTTAKLMLAAVLLAGPVAAARAADEDSAEAKRDRAVYTRLVSELRTAHHQLGRAYRKGIVEARENEGSASTETRAEILRLKEEIDRKSVRLMLVADRHGWDVPKFAIEELEDFPQAVEETEPEEPESASEQLFPDEPIIAEGLSRQAKQLAADVELPVITLAADEPAEQEQDDD